MTNDEKARKKAKGHMKQAFLWHGHGFRNQSTDRANKKPCAMRVHVALRGLGLTGMATTKNQRLVDLLKGSTKKRPQQELEPQR